MEKPRIAVRAAERSDADKIGRVLAAAFQADPMMRHLVPESRRFARLTALFAFEADTTPSPWVAVDGNQVAGAALWSPPGSSSAAGTFDMLRNVPRITRAFGTHLRHAMRSFRVIEDAHPKSPPHWYLQTIGAAQPGHGVGGALLRDGLARVDETRQPAYLESSVPSNVDIYRRYGFRVIGEIALPDHGPSLTAMWRDPSE